MPRGIPGSGKSAKKPINEQGAVTAPRVGSPRAGPGRATQSSIPAGERSYSVIEKFQVAQAYLSTIVSIAMTRQEALATSNHPVSIALAHELAATFEVLSRLRRQIFGAESMSGGSSGDTEPMEDRKAGDAKIRQNLPSPSHQPLTAPPQGNQGNQQAPFHPGSTN